MKKTILILISLFWLMSCGGSAKQESDYTQFSDRDMMALANKKFDQGDYKSALEFYNRLLLDYPTSDLHIDVQLKMAETYGRMDRFEDQMDLLLRLVRENIIPNEIPRIYIQFGKFYERSAVFNPGIVTNDSIDYQNALNYYKLATKYEDSNDTEAKAEATYRRGLVEAKIGDINAAISQYQMVPSLYPNSVFSVLAQMKLKNPEDVSELAVSDSALAVYRNELGLVAPEPVEEEAPAVIEEKEPSASGDEGNMDETLDMMKENTQEQSLPETETTVPDSL